MNRTQIIEMLNSQDAVLIPLKEKMPIPRGWQQLTESHPEAHQPIKGGSMPNLTRKFDDNTFHADDRNSTDERFLTADQCLIAQNPSDPDWLHETSVIFDSEAKDAYKDWQASLSHLEQNIQRF